MISRVNEAMSDIPTNRTDAQYGSPLREIVAFEQKLDQRIESFKKYFQQEIKNFN